MLNLTIFPLVMLLVSVLAIKQLAFVLLDILETLTTQPSDANLFKPTSVKVTLIVR